MSRWTHSICDECWKDRNPDRVPHRLLGKQDEICCVCGHQHSSGIFFRADPELLRCKGEHKED